MLPIKIKHAFMQKHAHMNVCKTIFHSNLDLEKIKYLSNINRQSEYNISI